MTQSSTGSSRSTDMKRSISIKASQEEAIAAIVSTLLYKVRGDMHVRLEHDHLNRCTVPVNHDPKPLHIPEFAGVDTWTFDFDVARRIVNELYNKIESVSDQYVAKRVSDYFDGFYGPPNGSRLVKLVGYDKAVICARAYEEWRVTEPRERMRISDALNSRDVFANRAALAFLQIDKETIQNPGYAQRLCKGIAFIIAHDQAGKIMAQTG